MLRRTAADLVRATRGLAPPSRAAVQATRRKALIAQIKATAIWNDATVDLRIDPDVRIGRRVRVTVEPWSHNVLHVGSGSWIDDDVLLQLKGGQVLVGPRVQLRRSLVLNVAGRLECAGDNVVSWNTVIHCSADVHIGSRTIIGEHVTIADSSHYFTAPEDHVWHNVRRGSVRIGDNTWICAKATLGRGADVGSHCIIGGNTVVTGEVPDGSIASGVPAVVRPLALPWTTDKPARAGS
jgi:acetyltransferase-like isoleucine patch superfamily enzyme